MRLALDTDGMGVCARFQGVQVLLATLALSPSYFCQLQSLAGTEP